MTTPAILPAAPQRLVYTRDLLRELVARDLKLRYKGSILGMAWSLLNPLAQLLVFGFVFRFVLPLDIPDYTIFLFTGLLAWNWFQTSLVGATTAILDGRQLIKRPGFPAPILPVVTVSANLLHFLLALPVLIVFILLTGIPLRPALLLLPLVVGLQFAFTLGLAYFLATIHVRFRDTQHLVGVFLLLLFYLTPIFYAADMVPDRFQTLYRLNPLLHLIDAYRAVLLRGALPPWQSMAGLLAGTAVLLAGGYTYFRHMSYQFVEEL